MIVDIGQNITKYLNFQDGRKIESEMTLRKYLIESGQKTAKLSRLLAKAIDIFLVLILSTLYYPLGLFLGIVYLAMSDGLQKGQSVGKKFIGLGVVSLIDGTPCTFKQSLVRNLPLTIPLVLFLVPLWGWLLGMLLGLVFTVLELYFLFKLDTGHRIGDVMADTTVIGNDPNRVDIRKKEGSWFDNEAAQLTQKTSTKKYT